MCDPFPAEEAATGTIFRCKFPGCLRSYGSTDAARKHARKTHPDWLKLADAAAAKRVRGGPSTKSSFYCAREEAPLLSPSSAVPNGGLLRLDSALERLGGEGACGGEGEAAGEGGWESAKALVSDAFLGFSQLLKRHSPLLLLLLLHCFCRLLVGRCISMVGQA